MIHKPARGKNVTSKDPRKARIVQALKEMNRCQRVTELKEIEPGVFEGTCLRYDGTGALTGCQGGYENIGRLQVLAEEAGVQSTVAKQLALIARGRA